jgi:hypothetical protein
VQQPATPVPQLYRASAVLPLIEDAIRQHSGPHADKLVARYADKLAMAHDGEHLTKFEELLEVRRTPPVMASILGFLMSR